MSSGAIACRLYMGNSNGILPVQGEGGTFNVLDELAIPAFDRDNPMFQYMPASALARQCFSDPGYTANDFLDRYVKPVHVSQGVFDSMVFPPISSDFIKAIDENGSAPHILGSATSMMLEANSLAEGMGRVQNELDIGISITKDPGSLLGWLLSQYFVMLIWLPPKCCFIPTPVEGKLIERPLSPNEIRAKNKIVGWLEEVA